MGRPQPLPPPPTHPVTHHLIALGKQTRQSLRAARLDASYDTEMRKLIGVELLILDDFALQALDPTETADLYELVVERHHSAATVLTSNRDPVKAHRFGRTCARQHLKLTCLCSLLKPSAVDVVGEVVNETSGVHAESLAGDFGIERYDEVDDSCSAQQLWRYARCIEHVG